ncbi:hypothetical protein MMC11_006253 [Xylographa trunciseda]|nr:hypothetical protein [Xylographa trunciseda]
MTFSVLGVLLTLWFPVRILCAGEDFYSRLPLPKERLFCGGNLPSGFYGDGQRAWEIREGLDVVACGEWDAWSHMNFTDVSDLCTIHGNPEGNYGGFCLLDGTARRPVFDIRLAIAVLLYDKRVEAYCKDSCFCPWTEDQYLATDLREAVHHYSMLAAESAKSVPTPLSPPRPPEWPGEPLGVANARRVAPEGRLRAYRGRSFRCMGVQGRGTSGMMSCYCGLKRLGSQLRAVSFFMGG